MQTPHLPIRRLLSPFLLAAALLTSLACQPVPDPPADLASETKPTGALVGQETGVSRRGTHGGLA